jgi:deoxyribodipyrimidine photo-lyase
MTVGPVDWAKPGASAGLAMLDEFCSKRLKLFGSKRSDPAINALSNLSPWFHFGKQLPVISSIMVITKCV